MHRFAIAAAGGVLALTTVASAQFERVTVNSNPANPFDIMHFGLDVCPARGDGCVVVGFGDRGAGAVRFDAAGNVLWERVLGTDLIGTGESAHAFSVQRTSDNQYIICGGIDPRDPNNPCYHLQTFLIKLDDNGSITWAHRYMGEGAWWDVDMFRPWPGTAVREYAQRYYYGVSTLKQRNSDCTPICDGNAYTGVLFCADANGNTLFNHQYTALGNDEKVRMAFTDLAVDGDYIVILGTLSPDNACDRIGNEDALVVVTDRGGNVLWSWALPVRYPYYPCWDPSVTYTQEWGSAIDARRGRAYVTLNFPFQTRCANGLDTRSIVLSLDYMTGAVNWSYAISNMWSGYAALRFGADGNLILGGNDIDANTGAPVAASMKLDPATGNPLVQWHYNDPRPIPTLNNIEGLCQGLGTDRIWLVGTTFEQYGSSELYLLATDAGLKAECSNKEVRIPLERAAIRPYDPRVRILSDLRDRVWEAKYEKPESKVIDPCNP